MKTCVFLAALLLLAVGAQADLAAEAPAAEPLAPAPAPSAGLAVDVPCPAPGVVYTTLDECDQAIAAGLDVAREQGVDLTSLEALGIEVPTNTTRSTTISSSTSINGQSVSIKYKRVIYRMDPTVYCCGLTVATSTGGNTTTPTGVATTSAAAPAWGLRSFAAAAALAAGAAALIM